MRAKHVVVNEGVSRISLYRPFRCRSLFLSHALCLSLCLTYRGNECGGEGIVRKTEEYAGLADTGVADEQQLEQQIVCLLRHFVAEAVPRRGVGAEVEEVNRVKRARVCGGAAVTRGRLVVAISSDDAPYIERYAPVYSRSRSNEGASPDELRRTYTCVDVSCRIIRANRSRRGGGLLKDGATSRDDGVNTTQKPSGVNAG